MSDFAHTLIYLIGIYEIVILIRILLSWVPPLMQTSFYFFLASITEPFLHIFRRILPPIGVVDFSPMLALLVLEAIKLFLARGFY
ncbi:MAG: YggT family protein [bacterium JZ-2024 1]